MVAEQLSTPAEPEEPEAKAVALLKELKESYARIKEVHGRRLQQGRGDTIDGSFLQPPFSLLANSESIRDLKEEILVSQLDLAKEIEKSAKIRERSGIAPPGTLVSIQFARAKLELAILELKQTEIPE